MSGSFGIGSAGDSNIEDLIHDNFISIDVSLVEFQNAISLCRNSKVCGNDKISSYMLKNCNETFLNTIVFSLLKFIFKHGVIPSNFNVTHIIPIIKDHNKPTNTINNLRPISISNTLAQIFERILSF